MFASIADRVQEDFDRFTAAADHLLGSTDEGRALRCECRRRIVVDEHPRFEAAREPLESGSEVGGIADGAPEYGANTPSFSV